MNHPRISSGAGLLLCALGAGCSTDLYVMGELYEVDGERRVHALSSCTPFDDRGPTPRGEGGPADSRDLVVKQEVDGDSFLVVVTSDDRAIARRKYGEKQIESGERDEFTVTTHAGRTYELAYWGGHRCETPSIAESE